MMGLEAASADDEASGRGGDLKGGGGGGVFAIPNGVTVAFCGCNKYSKVWLAYTIL